MRWAPWVGLCCLAAAAGFSWLHAYGAIPHADFGAAPRTVVVVGNRPSDLLGATGSRTTPSAPPGPSTAHAGGGAPVLGPGSTPIVIPRLPPPAAGAPTPGTPRVSPGKPQPTPGPGAKKPKPPTKPKPKPHPTPSPAPPPTPAPPGTPTPGPTTPPSGGAGGPTASPPPPSTPSEPVRTPADNPPPVPTPPCPSAPVTGASVLFAGGLATATFTVAAGCSSIPVSLVSYSLSSPGTAFATTTGSFAAGGPFTLSVHVPACGFGATLLVSGHALTSAAGGAACPPPPPPPPPPHSCPDTPVTNASVAFAGGLATATFTVAAGCSSIPVSLVSYSLSSPGAAFDTTTGSFAAGGPFTLSVHIPACGFGATLLVSGRALTSAAGGAACPPPPPPPHPPHSGCDNGSLHPDLHPCDPASTADQAGR